MIELGAHVAEAAISATCCPDPRFLSELASTLATAISGRSAASILAVTLVTRSGDRYFAAWFVTLGTDAGFLPMNNGLITDASRT